LEVLSDFIVDFKSTEKCFAVDFFGFQLIFGFAWCLCGMYNRDLSPALSEGEGEVE